MPCSDLTAQVCRRAAPCTACQRLRPGQALACCLGGGHGPLSHAVWVRVRLILRGEASWVSERVVRTSRHRGDQLVRRADQRNLVP
jgi:hypothetical protein